MFKKGLSLLQKLRNLPNQVKVLSTITVFSPTFVACYGMPMDEKCSGTRDGYDCIDGYIVMCDTTVNDVNYNANPQICKRDYDRGGYFLAECKQEGAVFTDNTCVQEDRFKVFYPDSTTESETP